MKDRMDEIDKHVSDGINKLLIENKCGLTCKEEFFIDEAQELAERAIRVKVPRRSTSCQSCPRSRIS